MIDDLYHCLLCQQEVTEDAMCWGCNEYICENCYGIIETPQGFHHPVAHLKSEDYDEEAEEDKAWERASLESWPKDE